MSRVQLALDVSNIDEAVAFYTKLFGTGPAKVRPSYAKQDKFWVQGAPDGRSWEIYTVLADSQTFYGEESGGRACCGGGTEADAGQPAGAAASAAQCC